MCAGILAKVCFAGFCYTVGTSIEQDLSNMPETNHKAKPGTDEARFTHRVQTTHTHTRREHPAVVALKARTNVAPQWLKWFSTLTKQLFLTTKQVKSGLKINKTKAYFEFKCYQSEYSIVCSLNRKQRFTKAFARQCYFNTVWFSGIRNICHSPVQFVFSVKYNLYTNYGSGEYQR